ncbi:MAG: molybdate ABC transporter substrate-binding protein [Oscillospiraceae bacterium]|jgi:molybdate transport system substrate-binding protein|nr:molybdate ABC transporter substrate-binding protein [Oscillospiraceae bacterium]
MKRILVLVLCLALAALLLASCSQKTAEPSSTPSSIAASTPEAAPEPTPEPAEPVSILVFAAASLKNALPEIYSNYQAEHPEVTIEFNFKSSGDLQTQIEEGAGADLFISAGAKQMTALNEKGLINSDTNIDLLVNKVVLVVPLGNPKGITTWEDVIDKAETLSIGDPAHVPAGQYTEESYTTLGLWDKITAKTVNYSADVTAVLATVESGDADAGFVYWSDAVSSGNVEVVAAAPEGSHKAVIYPAAVISDAPQPEAAQAFLDYLKTQAAADVFVKYGFTVA